MIGRRGAAPGETTRRRAPHGRLLAAFLMAAALVAFLLVAVFPTRTYLDQRAATRDADRRLTQLDARNAKLDSRIARLKTPEQIELIARREYGLVKKGEEVYAILPAPPPPVALPDIWPFNGVAESLNR